MQNKIKKSVNDTIEVLKILSEDLSADIEKGVVRIKDSIASGGKLILFGNGGSAADAQHIAAEFIGRFRKDREALPALGVNCPRKAPRLPFYYTILFRQKSRNPLSNARKNDFFINFICSLYPISKYQPRFQAILWLTFSTKTI